MKTFSFIVIFLIIILFIVIPGIEEYKKHKDQSKAKALLHFLTPLLTFIGMLILGFILFEFIPRIVGPLIENMIRWF